MRAQHKGRAVGRGAVPGVPGGQPDERVALRQRRAGGSWTCAWQRLGGETFLGWCGWFEAHGKPKKEILRRVVDEGCKYWAERTAEDQGEH